MGRFYKTAKPNMIDFMYQVPEQAILGAIKGADAQLEKQEQFLTDFQKQLKLQALDPDTERQKELLKQYEDQIKEYSLKISSNPLDALKQKQGIRDLGNKIYQDVTRGELGAQYAQYAIRQKHLEEETKRATNADGSIRQEDVDAAMAAFDRRYAAEKRDPVTGELIEKGGLNYNPATGKYRSYSPEKLVNYFDISEEAKRQAEGWEPDVDTDFTTQYLDKSGNYLITDKQGREILKKDDLAFGIYNTILTNPEATKQRNQMIRIMSGAKPGTEEYLREWEKIYGVRQDRGNLGSPFAMETVMQSVTDPATGKTEVKPLTRKVQKVDENGKPIEGEFEEKEVKRMVNPGEIFAISQAAADRKDKNKIVSSITQEATEPFKTALQQQKEIAVAKAKADYDEKLKQESTWDFATKEVITKTFGDYKTNQELNSSFVNRDTALSEKIGNTHRNLNSLIESAANLSKEQKQVHLTAIKNLIDKKDWQALQKYVSQNEIKGIKTKDGTGIGTGIDVLAEEISQEQTALANDRKAYQAIYNKTGNSIYKDGKTIFELSKEYKEKYGANSKEVKDLNIEWNKRFDTAIEKATNTTTVTSSNFNDPTLNDETKRLANKALKELKTQLPSLLSTGTDAMLILDGKGNVTNFNLLSESGKLDYANIVDEDDNKKHDATKPYYTVKRAGIVPQNLSNVVYNTVDANGKPIQTTKNIGKNAIELTLEINDNGKIKEATIYIDKSQAKNEFVDKAIAVTQHYNDAKNFVNQTKLKLNPIAEDMEKEEREKLFFTTPEGYEFYPYSGPGGGTWNINGVKLSEDAGTNLYAEKLKNK
jgi:hypothetical protein